MGGLSSWLPESGTPSGVPTLTAWGGGPHKYKVHTLSPHYEKRYPPPPQGPPLCCRDRDPPSGGGLQAYLPHPLKRIQKITSLYYLVKKIPYRPPINRVN